jgi:hypothetical protein
MTGRGRLRIRGGGSARPEADHGNHGFDYDADQQLVEMRGGTKGAAANIIRPGGSYSSGAKRATVFPSGSRRYAKR